MSNLNYDDWSWENPIPIECLSEQDIEDLKRIIDKLSELPLENILPLEDIEHIKEKSDGNSSN